MFKFLKNTAIAAVLLYILGSAVFLGGPHVTKPERNKPIGELDYLQEASDYVKAYGEQIVILSNSPAARSGGTGFFVAAKSGMIYTITNKHVCELSEDGKMYAKFDSGRIEQVTIIEKFQEHDLCILSATSSAKALPLAQTQAETNEVIFTIGHPRLKPNTFSGGLAYSKSKVQLESEQQTQQECKDAGNKWESFMTIFGPINICLKEMEAIETSLIGYPGNSGSPVFNKYGEIVGVIFIGDNATNTLGYVPFNYLQTLLSRY